MFNTLTVLAVGAALAVGTTVKDQDIPEPPAIIAEYNVSYGSHCHTPPLSQEETQRIIEETQTMDLNFVALAEAESGLYNHANNNNTYRGIFQVSTKYHKLEDYCDPAEQVRWLEGKLDAGARPERLFPSLHNKLYE